MADEITITMPRTQARLLVALALIALINLIVTGQVLGPILVGLAVVMIVLDRQRAMARTRAEVLMQTNHFSQSA